MITFQKFSKKSMQTSNQFETANEMINAASQEMNNNNGVQETIKINDASQEMINDVQEMIKINNNIQEMIKKHNMIKYYYNMSLYYVSMYNELNNSLRTANLLRTTEPNSLKPNSLLTVSTGSSTGSSNTSTTSSTGNSPNNNLNNLNMLNLPMNLSIVNNVLTQQPNTENTKELETVDSNKSEELLSDMICKYVYKKGIKKYTYCGEIISLNSPEQGLCNKHSIETTTAFKYKRGSYKKELDKKEYSCDELNCRRLYKRGSYKKKLKTSI